MTKYYSAPELEIRRYAIEEEQIFTSGVHDGDDFELDSDESGGATADSFFADDDN